MITASSAPKNLAPLFKPAQLRLMAFFAIGLLLFLSVFAIVWHTSLEHQVVRFTICLLTSLSLSVFFFVFWPQHLEMQEIPVIKLPIRVTGPVVLWMIVFLLFLTLMPASTGYYCQFFQLTWGGDQPLAFSKDIKLEGIDGESPTYCFVEDDKKPAYLGGIFVMFPPGVTSIRANLKVEYHNPLPVTFDREQRNITISGLSLEEKHR